MPIQELPQLFRWKTFTEEIHPPIAFEHDRFHGEFERMAVEEHNGKCIQIASRAAAKRQTHERTSRVMERAGVDVELRLWLLTEVQNNISLTRDRPKDS